MSFLAILSNAVKFTGTRSRTEIEVGCVNGNRNKSEVFVRDNGAGFDMQYVTIARAATSLRRTVTANFICRGSRLESRRAEPVRRAAGPCAGHQPVVAKKPLCPNCRGTGR